ncbi:MAG: DNA mismatch repair protein MutS [Candidatus Tectomicrobia bacterium]|nr:DNA mismatch repair protein MutS [Candidatus Tectomicrobia bacterium]
MMRQYRSMKQKYADAVLFFRMGDFYEMFYEDAETAAPTLNLALTSRHDDAQGPVPMCGFPYHALDGYVARLIRAGFRVAVCEQVEDPKKAKGLVRREVVQVVSPGTATQAEILESKAGNYLAALLPGDQALGFAYADLSTGEFRALQLEGEERWSALSDEWADLDPKELLLPEGLLGGDDPAVPLSRLAGAREPLISRLPAWAFHPEEGERLLRSGFGLGSLGGLGLDGMSLGVGAAGALYHYLRETQGDHLGHLRPPLAEYRRETMLLDAASVRNLEILRAGPEGERAGSLLQVLDQTVTPMGGRKLRSWLLHPLLRVEAVRARLEAVRAFREDARVRGELRRRLGQMGDLERILARLHLGSANARDLRHLSQSLEMLRPIREALSGREAKIIQEHLSAWDDLGDVAAAVDAAIVADPPLSVREGGLIRDGYHPELDRLRKLGKDAKSWLRAYEEKERERTGIKNLKVVYNKVFGYLIEVSKRAEAHVPPDYTRRQTLTHAERYATQELKETEEEVLQAESRSCELEHEIFQEVRSGVLAATGRIQAAAERAAVLDVLSSFAETAARSNYVEPEVDESGDIVIREGRHPALERSPAAVEERFVPNDAHLSASDRQILVVTGPNMAGKSTYIRQVALIVLLAQTGSFIPASSARIGLADRIFTRVGAHDRLQRGQSTFMVEMVETAYILHHATPRSLVILDEIGRGTSTFDGISIAWAVAEHLHGPGEAGPRTLFATHYHELADLAQRLPRVKNLTMSVREYRGEVVFLRQVAEGTSDRSYGIHVARLAGFPRETLERAARILETLEEGRQGSGRRASPPEESRQMALFAPKPAETLRELREADLDGMTPLEALNFLHHLKQLSLKEEGR